MKKEPAKLAPNEILLWNVHQAAEALNIPSGTLYGWVSQRMIPYVKVGGCLRFDPKDIKAWIESQKVDIADWRKK